MSDHIENLMATQNCEPSETFTSKIYEQVEIVKIKQEDISLFGCETVEEDSDFYCHKIQTEPTVEAENFYIKHEETSIKNEGKRTKMYAFEESNFREKNDETSDEKFKVEHLDIKEDHSEEGLWEQAETSTSYSCVNMENQESYVAQQCSDQIKKGNKSRKKKRNMLKCDHCDYHTIYKNCLNIHMFRHKNIEETDIFKCDHCSYQTFIKNYIKQHSRIHNKPEEVPIFKCDNCDFETIHKNNLREHKILHKNPDVVEKFKCTQCSYKTIFKRNLTRHSVIHKEFFKDIFKCYHCDYETVLKRNLRRHMLRHKEPDVDMCYCSQCGYQTVQKETVKSDFNKPEKNQGLDDSDVHMLRRKNPRSSNKYKCDECFSTFKCDQCDFRTKYRTSLRGHLFIHKNPSELEMLQCDQCSYQTAQKNSMKKHSIIHGKLEVGIFKCYHCDFQTRHRVALRKHFLRHKDPDEIVMFKCGYCDYQTKTKGSLKRHIGCKH